MKKAAGLLAVRFYHTWVLYLLEYPTLGDLDKCDGVCGCLADRRIVRHVGNYGEVFERNVGQGSPLKIARGLNALWTKGGLQYAPPIR